MKKTVKTKVILIVLVSTIFISATTIRNDFFEIAKQIEIFTTAFKELNMNYVDDTNPAELMDGALKSMLKDLDPYTQFYNEQDVEAARINNTGDYTGIGASVLTLKDKLIIVEPYKGYAADKAGLKAGDEIVKVGDVQIGDYTEDAGDLLKGSPGSSVRLTYKRQDQLQTVDLIRESQEIKAVPFYKMVNETTGYIVLRKFNAKASQETSSALRSLKNQGATNLILDLRGNPGGLLNEAVNITNLFVPKGQLVVTTKSKIKKYNKTYYTQRDPIDTEIPLVVLIDGKSASASEIVSGALQDLDRAIIVGARSFGKGLVQRPKSLAYGTQMKITISRYYTPSGRCIQALDYWNRDDKGNATRVKKENYNLFKTKKGRSVYDGGGIQPDIEIPLAKDTPITKAIESNYLIFNYATDYYYKNSLEDLNTFNFKASNFNDFKRFIRSQGFSFETNTEKAFNDAFIVASDENLDDSLKSSYDALISNIEEYKAQSLDVNKNRLNALLEEEIIKRYFYSEGYYEYSIKNNSAVIKSVQLLNNPLEYRDLLE
ncbi:MAG: S41 family peptidase [Winogradskyella sp.]|nr:S41 family peptidase [Winogradskyella sp.]MBT8376800.1 S41 family peptidase [Bacteroidia bacterium]NNC45112.1 S41 family peptidase [Winogradskyella sp.]NNF85278.1 S41 family peptidase [Winogradskyella sp.]NNK39459.1 S41 family peptidase [Winogradskyella sp.]